MFITGVCDTGVKFATGFNDAGDKFAICVINDDSSLPLVSRTSVVNNDKHYHIACTLN
jgi:hypothetical protein